VRGDDELRLRLERISLSDEEGRAAMFAEVRGESGETYIVGTQADDALLEPETTLRLLANEISNLRQVPAPAKLKVASLMPPGWTERHRERNDVF